jgi:hypothetical protein
MTPNSNPMGTQLVIFIYMVVEMNHTGPHCFFMTTGRFFSIPPFSFTIPVKEIVPVVGYEKCKRHQRSVSMAVFEDTSPLDLTRRVTRTVNCR